MSVDQVLKLSLLALLTSCVAILLDELPMDDGAVKNATDQEAMARTCLKPAGVSFGLKSLFFCQTDKEAEE